MTQLHTYVHASSKPSSMDSCDLIPKTPDHTGPFQNLSGDPDMLIPSLGAMPMTWHHLQWQVEVNNSTHCCCENDIKQDIHILVHIYVYINVYVYIYIYMLILTLHLIAVVINNNGWWNCETVVGCVWCIIPLVMMYKKICKTPGP